MDVESVMVKFYFLLNKIFKGKGGKGAQQP